ncbi:MAG: hypothetical protein KJP10_11225 [Gammaproteobacteria bacterium]|nr:hypothetical protein [Gammaproteobacteria bacterium]
MKKQYRLIKQAAVLIPLLLGSAGAAAFPEIPFCPLGGPPGWWNRMVDDDDHYYPPPPYYPPLQAAPYQRPHYPYSYVPQSPAYPQPLIR